MAGTQGGELHGAGGEKQIGECEERRGQNQSKMAPRWRLLKECEGLKSVRAAPFQKGGVIVVISSADVGWMATVSRKSRIVAPILIATAKPARQIREGI